LEKIFFFGGSFDPPHIGHIDIADICLEHCETLIIFPAKQSPVKLNKPSASVFQRLEMLSLSFQSANHIVIDDFELNSKKPNYTIYTIHYLKKKFPNSELTLVIGGDQWSNFNDWYKWKDILKEVKIFCLNRSDLIKENIESLPNGIQFIKDYNCKISSTEIRKMININPESVHNSLHPDVFDYILENGIYI
jgi:nicotinate-nucleotide adenylyltransferase